jgi:glycogen phosphorylase
MTKLQQHRIGINGSFFNTHRMSAQYFRNAYFPPSVIETAEPPVPRRRASDKSAKPTLA